MNIAWLPRYDTQGASSRYRFFMYFQHWSQLKTQDNIAIYPGLSNKYLQELYQHGKVGKLRQARELARLFKRTWALPENLIIEYELIPALPWKYEKILLKNHRYILNFDDNVWVKYKNNPALIDKYDQLCRNAAGIIAANHFLLEKVQKLNKNCCMIPTVVDLDKYSVQKEKFEKFTLVWIGTPVTYCYLEQHLPILQQLTADGSCELLIIADSNLQYTRKLPGVQARYVTWSSECENELLSCSHVGIMPLTDDDFSQGKSAFKLLQYQASGLPLIASPVGENNQVVKPGKNGFLPENAAGWLAACQALQNDQTLYENCSKYARSCAYDYSIQKYFSIYREFVLNTFGQ